MNSIIKYSLDDFKMISESFDAELDTDIINSLLEIKKNNRFVKRKTPLKLKYTVSSTWRINENKNIDLTNEEILLKTVTSSLNKLSNDNFNIIFDVITREMTNYSDVSFEKVIDIIFEKSLEENFYCDSYSKLLSELVKINDSIFRNNYLKGKCRSFYEYFLKQQIDENDLQNDDYDIVCEVNEKKSNIISGFMLIASLYNLNILEYSFIKEIFLTNVEKYNNNESKYIGIYIDVMINLIEISSDKIKQYHNEDFNSIFIETIKKFIQNKTKVAPKYRFKMSDLLDKLEIS